MATKAATPIDKSAKIKIIFSVVAILVALVLIANQAGLINLFGGGEKAAAAKEARTPEQLQADQEELELLIEEQEMDIEEGIIDPPSGS